MELLDRERELALLGDAFAQAVRGRGGVALVTGEAGIGKTSLIRTFVDDLDESVRVLKGACEDLSVAEPLGPLHDLLRGTRSVLSDDIGSSENLLTVFTEALTALSDHTGATLVVIEDLHWADDATIDFIRFATRRLTDHPIYMIVSARAEQAAGRQLIRRAFGDLPSDLLCRISLGPLSEGAVTHLCRARGREPGHIYGATGGNAFFVSELLKDTEGGLPQSIQDAVLARVDRLGSDARAVLEITSAIPRRAEIDDVTAVAGTDIDLDEGIEECLDAGLLLTDGDALFFAHELAREAVLSSLSPLAVRRLNQRLFRFLSEKAGVGFSRLLHHAQGAGDLAAVAELAPRAARSAADIGSRRESAAFYAIAVEAAGDSADTDLLEAAAWSSYLAGNHTVAADFQARAMEGIGGADTVRKAEGLRKLSRYHWVRSDYSAAFDCINEAIRLLSAQPGPELALAYSALSQLYMTAYRFDDVSEPAMKAIALAREFDRPDVTCHALNNLGMSNTHRDTERARQLLSESLALAVDLDDPDHIARARINWMTLEYDKCEFSNALDVAEKAADFAGAHELDAYYRYALGMIARARHRLGTWNKVQSTASRGFDPDDRVPKSFNFNGAIALFMHEVRTGGEPDANLREYLALYDNDAAEGQRIGPYAEIMAERAWLQGAPLGPEIARLQMAAANASYPQAIGGVHVWLNRLGVKSGLEDLTEFPEPFRLELSGDRRGAARSWAARGARYDEALALSFGSIEDKRRALEIFRQFGEIPAVSRIAAELGTSARPRGRPPATGPHGLTARQLAVLELLAEGLTNNQIGEKLCISPKTVDHHVSAILSKLEASSRGEAAAVGRRRGII